MHTRWTGRNAGWDRWLDNHWGLEITSKSLDAFVAPLARRNASFRAHAGYANTGGYGSDEGSLWTSGVDGQGVELHGDFDWTVLDQARRNVPSLRGTFPPPL